MKINIMHPLMNVWKPLEKTLYVMSQDVDICQPEKWVENAPLNVNTD